MIWTRTSYNTDTSGPYAVTGHRAADGAYFFIAYWGQNILAGSCETADAAKAICEAHNGARQ